MGTQPMFTGKNMKKMNDTITDEFNDPFDVELEIYVKGAVAKLRSKGLPPISVIEIISTNKPSVEENQLSWESCEKLIFIELKRQIYRSLYGDICPF